MGVKELVEYKWISSHIHGSEYGKKHTYTHPLTHPHTHTKRRMVHVSLGAIFSRQPLFPSFHLKSITLFRSTACRYMYESYFSSKHKKLKLKRKKKKRKKWEGNNWDKTYAHLGCRFRWPASKTLLERWRFKNISKFYN